MLPWWSEDELFAPLFNTAMRRSTHSARSLSGGMPFQGFHFSENENNKSLEEEQELVTAEEGELSVKNRRLTGKRETRRSNNGDNISSRANLRRVTGLRNRISSTRKTLMGKQQSAGSGSTPAAIRSPARVEPKVQLTSIFACILSFGIAR